MFDVAYKYHLINYKGYGCFEKYFFQCMLFFWSKVLDIYTFQVKYKNDFITDMKFSYYLVGNLVLTKERI